MGNRHWKEKERDPSPKTRQGQRRESQLALCAAGLWEPGDILEISAVSCPFLEETESPGSDMSSSSPRNPCQALDSREAEPALRPQLTASGGQSP